jgi:hypothetical protein
MPTNWSTRMKPMPSGPIVNRASYTAGAPLASAASARIRSAAK